ncbi:MAG: tail fiber domain-containing protein [Bdellovibrionia bacterium]
MKRLDFHKSVHVIPTFKRWSSLGYFILTVIQLTSDFALAADMSQSFTYQGRFYNSSGTAPLADVVDLSLGIYDPSGTCLLYEESQTNIDLTGTNGLFAVQVGTGLNDSKRTGSDPSFTMAKIFGNSHTQLRPATVNCPGGYTPTPSDVRYLRVTVTPHSTLIPSTLSPDQLIGSQSSAIVAQTLLTLKAPIASPTFTGNVTAPGYRITGGSTYDRGVIYSDPNWGMLFRAAIDSPAMATFAWRNGADSEYMRISPSGNVGIGTTAPRGPLQIGTGDGDKIIFADSGGIAGSKIAHLGGWGLGYYTGRSAYNDGGYHAFYTSNATSYNEAMRITSSGNIGIGTNNPDALLKVAGVAGFSSGFNGMGNTFTNRGVKNGAVIMGYDSTNHIGNLVSVREDVAWVPMNYTALSHNFVVNGAGTTTMSVSSGNVSVNGTITATAFNGAITGNVTGNTSGTAGNVTGIVAIANGGTGSNSGTFASGPYSNDWFRINGSTPGAPRGIHWQDWGGGWTMTDANWVRSFQDKGIYTGGQMQAGSMQSNGTLGVNGTLTGAAANFSGRVGIGTSNPSYTLHVAGSAGLSSGTSWTNASDIRLKDVHGDYEYGLDEILKLHTVRFNYKKGNPLGLPDNKPMIGFIAQEVQKIIPDAIHKNQNGYLELNVDPIHWAVVNAIKRLYLKVTGFSDLLAAKDKEIATLKASLCRHFPDDPECVTQLSKDKK